MYICTSILYHFYWHYPVILEESGPGLSIRIATDDPMSAAMTMMMTMMYGCDRHPSAAKYYVLEWYCPRCPFQAVPAGRQAIPY